MVAAFLPPNCLGARVLVEPWVESCLRACVNSFVDRLGAAHAIEAVGRPLLLRWRDPVQPVCVTCVHQRLKAKASGPFFTLAALFSIGEEGRCVLRVEARRSEPRAEGWDLPLEVLSSRILWSTDADTQGRRLPAPTDVADVRQRLAGLGMVGGDGSGAAVPATEFGALLVDALAAGPNT